MYLKKLTNMYLMNLFKKSKLINWKEPDIIELYRLNIEQNIIDLFGDSTFSCFNQNYINKDKDIKIIINIECGYSKWVSDFLNKNKQNMNDYAFFYIDINDISTHYLNSLADINNRVKQDLIMMAAYGELEKDFRNFLDESVYFIYQKNMITVFNFKEWGFMISEIFRVLKNMCVCEFIEYDFKIKKVEKNSISYKINNHIEKKLQKLNMNTIIAEINKKFTKTKIKKIIMPLYNEPIFEGACRDNVIIGYSHFAKGIIKMLRSEHGINLDQETMRKLLFSEWERDKCHIELYIISATKIIYKNM